MMCAPPASKGGWLARCCNCSSAASSAATCAARPRRCRRDLPILIVSGADDLLPRVRELKLDHVDFLRKPFSLMELLTRVDRSLSQAVAREHLRNEASIDDLTGLGNPRYLRERLSLEQ